MPLALHFFPYSGSFDLSQAAADQVALNRAKTPKWAVGDSGQDPSEDRWVHRVVEMGDPSEEREPPADLSLSRQDLPEVMAAIQSADEIHIHGLGLEIALNTLPYVKPETVANTPIILRGPSAAPPVLRKSSIARLQSWPGPVYYDQSALCTLRPESTDKNNSYAALPVIDPWHEHLQPNPTIGRPYCEEDTKSEVKTFRVTIALSRSIPISIGEKLKERWSVDNGGGKTLLQQEGALVELTEWFMESRFPSQLVRKFRRASALFVARGWNDREILDAALQGLPIAVVGSSDKEASAAMREFWSQHGITDGVTEINGEDEVAMIQGLEAAVVEFAETWIRGEALPAPTVDRSYWERAMAKEAKR